jgi:hypothetical protein
VAVYRVETIPKISTLGSILSLAAGRPLELGNYNIGESGRRVWRAVYPRIRECLRANFEAGLGTDGGFGPVEAEGDPIVIDLAGLMEQTAA